MSSNTASVIRYYYRASGDDEYDSDDGVFFAQAHEHLGNWQTPNMVGTINNIAWYLDNVYYPTHPRQRLYPHTCDQCGDRFVCMRIDRLSEWDGEWDGFTLGELRQIVLC